MTTQQMILFTSERSADGTALPEPTATYSEILGLSNAAYVSQHLHHHLRSRLGLDVSLPAGFCSSVRMASLISTCPDKPEAFGLFACSPQPLGRGGPSADDETGESTDDLMRMQLKVTDSTTGLSDKDVKKLTAVRHTVPKDFRELASLCENFAGVNELNFGRESPITVMLKSWVHFLTKAGGMTVANLRQLAHADK